MRLTELEILRPAHASPAKRMAKKIRPEKSNQAGRPTAAELERRKTRVMEVATELFVSRGYAATSIVDIAKGAGVATRTLYQHFGDKEAIFKDVIFARDNAAVHTATPSLEIDDTLHLVLSRTARYSCAVALRQQSIDLMRLMVAESNRFPDLMRKVATTTFARFRRNVGNVFESLEAAGLLPHSNHTRSAELFVDLVLGNTPIMTYTNWETAPPTPEDLDERVSLFILGRFGAAVAKTAKTKRARKPKA